MFAIDFPAPARHNEIGGEFHVRSFRQMAYAEYDQAGHRHAGNQFLLTVCGAIANLLNWNTVSIIAYALSAFLMLALIILLLIEQHQDGALNEQENR